ncbi:unnamed protein product [Nippostrongylus brasiliensis]|uniref:G_PROTEIN_RECEP_F1_2 domain-containing protein n=1 Tax=Nippostrongylus brasiliensis TaxID=27835 RepID=A0A158R2K7_NIPBR|nr:unnamed protein product [Nippostrongylus brasiliensis]
METPEHVLPIVLFFNALVLITYPLHVVFVMALFRNRYTKAQGTPFHHLVLNIGISDLISATSHLLFQEPAWLGIASPFYINNAWWIAKLWRYPIVQRITCCIWLFTALVSMPIIYPMEFGAYRTDNGRLKSVAYYFVSASSAQFYTFYLACLSILILPTIVIYVYLLLFIIFLKFVTKSKRHIILIAVKSIVAAFCTSLGYMILIVVLGSQQVYWALYKEDLMSPATFWLSFKIGRDLHNIATPWVMLIFYKTFRRSIIYRTSQEGRKS